MGISSYSTTPASNTALFPEGMARATVNDSSRQVQADIRSWYETAEWVDYGYTPTYASTTSFTMSGDRTSFFLVGRRIKMNDLTVLTGTIATSSFGGGNTTVTVTMDSGSLSASLTAVALGIVSIPTGGTGSSIVASGNVNGQASSVDSEIALFSGTGGKTIKRATGTGVVKVVSGVYSAATIVNADIANSTIDLTAKVTGSLPVANGGTGRNTNTAYAVVCGGTTTGGAEQSIASVGTSGQVLTSNGAGALPTFQNILAGRSIIAWLTFNGTGTPTILDSFNVSSITDNGTGDYTINFTSTLANANYAMVGNARIQAGTTAPFVGYNQAAAPTTSACRIAVKEDSSGLVDSALISVVFIGD